MFSIDELYLSRKDKGNHEELQKAAAPKWGKYQDKELYTIVETDFLEIEIFSQPGLLNIYFQDLQKFQNNIPHYV